MDPKLKKRFDGDSLRSLYNGLIVIGLLLLAVTGCKKIPCYTAEHYATPTGAPYLAEDVRLPTLKGHTLAGTLTLPTDARPPFPAVLLITGSSPQERDHMGNPSEPVSHYKPFRQIADSLSRSKIAVLRIDDQGVGCSGGGPLEDITIQERADDSRAGIKYLRSRKEIDTSQIGLLGLSEGANIAPLIAATDPSIHALVMLAGSATNGYKILEYQRRLKYSERTDLNAAEKELRLKQSMAGLRKALKAGEGSPWFRSFIKYLPLPAAGKVKCPALILHGDKDAHVPVEHARLLARAMRRGGNDDVTVKIFKDHNHLFLNDPNGNISGYLDLLQHTNKVSTVVLGTITVWLSEQFTVE